MAGLYIVIHNGRFMQAPKLEVVTTRLWENARKWDTREAAQLYAEPGDFVLSTEELMDAINEALSKRRSK